MSKEGQQIKTENKGLRNNLIEHMKDKGVRTLFELIFGTVFVNLIAVFGVFFCKNKLAYLIGLLTGCILACFMAFHMYSVLGKAILLDKDKAKRKTEGGAFFRMLLMVAALIASVLLPEYISIVGIMIGILSLKLGAEFQLLTSKAFDNFFPELKKYYDKQIEKEKKEEKAGKEAEELEKVAFLRNNTDEKDEAYASETTDSVNNHVDNEDMDDLGFIFGGNEELNAAINEAVNFGNETNQ